MRRYSLGVSHFAFILFVALVCTNAIGVPGDSDADGDRDRADVKSLIECLQEGNGGPGAPVSTECGRADFAVDQAVDLRDFAALQNNYSPWVRIVTSSPSNGEGMVALTRETIINLSGEIDITTVADSDIFATFAGATIPAMLRPTPDGLRLRLFYEPPLPPSARVRVTLVGTGILDKEGNAVDADGDDQPGGTAFIDFDTCTVGRIPNTNVEGYVIASEPKPNCTPPPNEPPGIPGMCDNVLQGVTIWADGFPRVGVCDGNPATELCAVTDASGHFLMQFTPAPEFFVEVDGTTITSVGGQPPAANCSFPTVGKPFHSVAGYTSQLSKDGMPFMIHLPCVADDSMTPLNANAPTDIVLSPTGQAMFEQMFPGSDASKLCLTVPANSLTFNDGTLGTSALVFPVDSSRLPAPLGAGNVHAFDITIQTDGATNFEVPAPICFPNVPDPSTGELPLPGEKLELVGFNHDTGKWEARGPMTVLDDDSDGDGDRVCSDPGFGVIAPGWHGQTPGSPGSGGGGSCGAGAGGFGALQAAESCDGPGCNAQAVLACLAAAGAAGGTCGLSAAACTASAVPPATPTSPLVCYSGVVICISGIAGAVGVCLPCISSAEDAAVPNTMEAIQGANLPPKAVELHNLLLAIQPSLDQLHDLASGAVASGMYSPADLIELQSLRADFDNAAGGDFLSVVTSLVSSLQPGLIQQPIADTKPTAPIRLAVTTIQGVIARGQTSATGDFDIVLANSDEPVGVAFFDPVGSSVGFTQSPRIVAGQATKFPDYLLRAISATDEDTDGDGLADVAEAILGTDPFDSDSDDDGVPDGAEIRNGTNPLDGRPTITGIIASSDTAGTAVDICAINDVAMVADSDRGVTVFNVTNGQAPVAIAQVDTLGTALAVSCSGNLIAVADGPEGLQIIDITDPPASRIVRQIPARDLGGGSAQAVATVGDLAFVGTTRSGTTGGRISMVELPTGVVLQRFDLSGTVQDIAVEGSNVYAFANGRLHVLPLVQGFFLQTAGSVAVPGGINASHGRGRLFVGGGIAYVVVTNGYHTFNVSNPSAPLLIAQAGTAQTGWKGIALNGSGLGIAAVGPNPSPNAATDEVYLFNTSNPMQTNQFLTLFPTPGITRAVSLYNGLAYVADDGSGMQVVNYLAYDALGQPPTGALTTSAIGSTLSEGERVFFRAGVADDVQVRNVEFFINGQRAVLDGNFPFEFAFRAPPGSRGQTFTATAVARDTGGNSVNLGPIALTAVGDDQPPIVVVQLPTNGSTFFRRDVIKLKIVATDNVAIASISFVLDGAAIAPRRFAIDEWELDAPDTLGNHQLIVSAMDTAGNTGSASPLTFLVRDQAISRAFTVFNDRINPVAIKDVVSRQFSVLLGDPPAIVFGDAVSRVFTVLNDLINPVAIKDVVSRQFTVESAPAVNVIIAEDDSASVPAGSSNGTAVRKDSE